MPPKTAFNIFSWCANSPAPVYYNKTFTSGNDPSISEKMRYSQLVRTSKYRRVVQLYPSPITPAVVPIYTLAAGQVRPFSQVI